MDKRIHIIYCTSYKSMFKDCGQIEECCTKMCTKRRFYMGYIDICTSWTSEVLYLDNVNKDTQCLDRD